MPESHKSENGPNVEQDVFRPTQGHENVADRPTVKGTMPALPEPLRREIVAHAPDHVFLRKHPVRKPPQPKESPRDQQFHPDNHQIEIPNHAQLQRRRFHTPPRLRFADRDHVQVVQHELHDQDHGRKPHGVAQHEPTAYFVGWVSDLFVVITCQEIMSPLYSDIT